MSQIPMDKWDGERLRRAQESLAARVIEIEDMKDRKREAMREMGEEIAEAQKQINADARTIDEQVAARESK